MAFKIGNQTVLDIDGVGGTRIDSATGTDVVLGAGTGGEISIPIDTSLNLPSGTTLQRPTGEVGMVRHNTDLNQFEGYNNGAWGPLSEGDFLPLSGGTLTGDILLGDNVKAIFGLPGNDLKIYHDGADSYIEDAGTGSLWLASNEFRVSNAAATENMIIGTEDAEVQLYYDNAKKFETTSTGVDISGILAINGTDIPDFHRAVSIAGGTGFTTDFKHVFDDGFMIQCTLTGTNNVNTSVVHTFPTAYSNCMGTSLSILDNGNREGTACTKGSASNTQVTVFYRLGHVSGSVGTAYVMVYSWGLA